MLKFDISVAVRVFHRIVIVCAYALFKRPLGSVRAESKTRMHFPVQVVKQLSAYFKKEDFILARIELISSSILVQMKSK